MTEEFLEFLPLRHQEHAAQFLAEILADEGGLLEGAQRAELYDWPASLEATRRAVELDPR